jgi:alpha-tubulin suppressor-like RCC1 family protein
VRSFIVTERPSIKRPLRVALPFAVALSGFHCVSDFLEGPQAHIPVASISSISPLMATEGDSGFTLDVRGDGFVPFSQVRWNSLGLSTVFETRETLRASVLSGNVSTSQLVTVRVSNAAGDSSSFGAEVFLVAMRFTSVSAGGASTCGVRVGGRGYCWGANNAAELGNGTRTDAAQPVLVVGGQTFTSLGIGAGEHACGVGPVVAAAYCWGDNTSGQLGNGLESELDSVPALVSGGHTFLTVTTGDQHTCGITTDSVAYCWGRNAEAELGIGSTSPPSDTALPVSVATKFRTISAGIFDSCAVTSGGTVYCWGTITVAAGFMVDSFPAIVTGGLQVQSLSAGYYHTCAVAIDGTGYCWGDNSAGQLGNGTTASSDGPLMVAGGRRFSLIAAGGTHSCGIATDSAAYCWGRNDAGQLGDSGTTQSLIPTRVSGGHHFQSISAGGGHSCAVTIEGTAYCWGEGYAGKLGSGMTQQSTFPIPVFPPRSTSGP